MIKKYLALVLLTTSVFFTQQYNIIHYVKSQDKIGNQVWSIFQDSKGYMWFATSAGLVRYNGWEYEVFDKEKGLIESFVFDISEDNEGNIWVGCPSGILRLKLGGDPSTPLEIQNISLGKFNDFYRVFVDSYQRIWAYNTVSASDVYFIDKGVLHNFSEKYRFKNQRVLHIAEDNRGVYMLTDDGKIYKYFVNDISEVTLPSEALGIKSRMFFFNSKGELVLCGQGGVASINLNDFTPNPKLNLITNISSMYAIETKFGDYWIATEQKGLIKVNENSVSAITEENGLPTNDLYTLFEDREGILWIGTAIKGIFKLPSLRFSSFGKKEGFTQGAISSITVKNSNIYCTTENGIFLFDQYEFHRIPLNIDRKDIVSPLFIFYMLALNDNEWLIGSSDGLLLMQNNGKSNFLGLKNIWVQTLFKDSKGRIWIGTNKGLYFIDRNFEINLFDIGIKDVSVNAIIVQRDASGKIESQNLFLGTTDGLIVINDIINNNFGNKITRFTTEDGLSSELIMDMELTSEGELLIGTAKGISILKNNNILPIDNDLTHPFIVDLFIDSLGNLWAGTNYGLNKLVKKDGKYIITEKYYEKDGLVSNEYTRNNTISQDKYGRIWFGTFQGLSVYNPDEDHNIQVPPICYLSSVQINDTLTYSMNEMRAYFSYNENKFKFFFEGLTYFDEKNVLYEYYLEPLESEWSKSTDIPNTSYGYLNPGDYIFHVRAVNQFGIRSNEQSYRFSISPPYWSTWWFLLLLGFLVLILFYVGYLYRTKQMRKRNLLLQKLVDEKTHQLKNTNEKLETQYKDLLEAQKKLVEKEKLEEAFREIEKLKNRLAVENIYLREKQTTVYEVSSLVGNSEGIKYIRKLIQEVAPTSSTVLITGETGTGKTLVGEAIHALSERKERTLVVVNCAAIPDGLIESELFGHEKGAFTGAHIRREGKFEIADGSTIFLDEIGDMNLHVQAKILTFLQDRKFSRLGGNEQITVDVRIIAATNYNLEQLVNEGKFRKDLFHRLQVFNIYVPSLRNRVEDIEPLSKYFADRFAKLMNKNITAISKSALEKLKNYPFPGNIRELENIMQRAIIVCKTGVITDEDIVLSQINGGLKQALKLKESMLTLEDMERQYIYNVLLKTDGKIAGKDGAAELLGLHPNTLRSKMAKLKIQLK
ncbi:hypothetical protein ASZ90_004816 [hydrocarbon metagenome]|uniref:Sigma-54 factor interaction domain-containing protein n=1 Tax=hydrocarbon metagenome TaxID=938273 RepID=A0A0W8FYN5_9ZZZZ